VIFFQLNFSVNFFLTQDTPNLVVPMQNSGVAMEQRTLKNVNNCLNTNIHSYLETSGGQSYNPYLYVVHFFNTSVN